MKPPGGAIGRFFFHFERWTSPTINRIKPMKKSTTPEMPPAKIPPTPPKLGIGATAYEPLVAPASSPQIRS